MAAEAHRNAIVVGLGSIGQRHARLLREAGLKVRSVSRRHGQADFSTVQEAIGHDQAAWLVVATETSRHMGDLHAALEAGHVGPVLVEKPLASTRNEVRTLSPAGQIWVGYNLRFSPVVRALRKARAEMGGRVIAVQMHVGQHLDTWRPGTDARQGYSAHRQRGGGALRDLSHELDLSQWLWGRATGVCALGGRRADVTVDSDDCWSMAIRTENDIDVLLSMNYLDRPTTRTINVTCTTGSIRCDLARGEIAVNGIVTVVQSDRDASYRDMWADLLAADARGTPSEACDLPQALDVVAMIDAVELHADRPKWIDL